MYSMDRNSTPTKPVITSLASANRDIAKWLEENQYQTMVDRDGMTWTVTIDTTVEPHPEQRRQSLLKIRIQLKAAVTAESLVRTGVLSEERDERLLAMLADSAVTLAMKPMIFEAKDPDEGRSLLADELAHLRARLRQAALGEIKRELVGRWLNGQCAFGERP